jgi:hypothetical protein
MTDTPAVSSRQGIAPAQGGDVLDALWWAAPYRPADCPHGAWSLNGRTWTCHLCGDRR